MPLKLKVDEAGKPMFGGPENNLPILIDDEGREWPADYEDLRNKVHSKNDEAAKNRLAAKEAKSATAVLQDQVDAFGGVTASDVASMTGEMERLRAKKPTVAKPTDSELDELLATRHAAEITRRDSEAATAAQTTETLQSAFDAQTKAYHEQFLTATIATALDSIDGLNPKCRGDAKRYMLDEWSVEAATGDDDQALPLRAVKRDDRGQVLPGTGVDALKPEDDLEALVKTTCSHWLLPKAGSPPWHPGGGGAQPPAGSDATAFLALEVATTS